MAQISVYRAAYRIEEDEYERVYFSEWVTTNSIPYIENVISEIGEDATNATTVETTPVIIGWYKMELDTEPV